MPVAVLLTVVVLGVLAPAYPAPAVPAPAEPRMAKFTVPGTGPATHMGNVALSDTLLASGAEGFRSFRGAVFLFDRATGQKVGTLTRPGSQPFDRFGSALAFDGSGLIVGATGAGSAGYAARYSTATGAERVRYEPVVPVPGSYFGSSLAIDGGVVAVGAPGTFPFPPDEGQVHLFDHVTGAPLGSITSPDPTGIFGPSHFFGASLAADRGLLVVGAPGKDYVGTAFIYDLATASQLHRLDPPPGFPPSTFGTAVDIAGGRVAVGDPEADGFLGVVHVYDAGTGDHLYTVQNTVGEAGTSFGASVALDGRRLAVGDAHADVGPGQGVVALHDAVTGALREVLNGFPLAETHRFGGTLALHGGALAVGDVQDNEVATYAGAAYLVTFP